jgi:hypothetical protein
MAAADLLREELADARELESHTLELSRMMNVALLQGDNEAIASIARQKQTAILERGRLDRRRTTLMPSLCAELGVADDATLRQLVQACDEQTRGELEPQIDELRAIGLESRELNQQNSALAEFELHLIKNLVRSAANVSDGSGAALPHLAIRLVDVEA